MHIKSLGPMLGLSLALVVATVTRTAHAAQMSDTLRWEELPAAVQNVIKDIAKGDPIRQLSRTPDIYTARFDHNGQKSEVRVAENGRILRSRSKQEAEALFEEEQRLAQAGQLNTVALDQVPLPVRAVIAERAKEAKLEQIVKAPAVFTAAIDRNGTPGLIRVASDGRLLGETRP